MITDRAKEAAGLLVEAHRNRKPIAGLPPSCLPQNTDEAYAIQDAIAALRGRIRGWKFSPSTPHRCGPVFDVERSGATLEVARFHGLGVEIELGFRLTQDLPPRALPYGKAEVLDRLEFVPLMELLASRFVDRKACSPLENLADCMSNGGFIVGAPIADWRGVDFGSRKVELAINGRVVQSAAGSSNAATLLDGAIWLANHTAGRTGGLRAGDVVTTGALKGTSPAKAGDTAVGDWGPLGRVEVQFR